MEIIFEKIMEMYCCEFKNTKDGSSNFSLENILNRQLIFIRYLTPYQKKNYRWIKYLIEAEHSQEEIISDFETKFEVKCIWEELRNTKGHTWNAWVIQDKPKEQPYKEIA